MSTALRFAPSPTGLLHVGNLRAAVFNWLLCRKLDGNFMLRIDDTDTERSTEEYTQGVYEDMQWLGLNWDRTAKQSDRFERYEELAEKLKADGRLYACYETPEELSLKRKSLLSRGLPPIYDRGALDLTAEQVAAYEAEGRKPHWRFKLKDETISWDDGVHGTLSFEGTALTDPVLIREDGRPLYTFTSVVDDIDFGISHIVRGDDHITNSATQLQLFDALGGDRPGMAHFALLTDASGGGLSKRHGALSLKELREEMHIEPEALKSLMARLGTSDPIEAEMDDAARAENFDLSKVSKNNPKFDLEELKRLNSAIVHNMDFATAAPRLEAHGITGVTEELWMAIRGNLDTLADAAALAALVSGEVTPVIEDADYTAKAAELLPDDLDWSSWTKALKTETGRKGKQLFMPLRLALTGEPHGPELGPLLPLIGRDRCLKRLGGDAA
ncbi:MAG: glutamate--tRNA ligase [Alphaproteobacteria bacterium]